jgi:hypothetical protein
MALSTRIPYSILNETTRSAEAFSSGVAIGLPPA